MLDAIRGTAKTLSYYERRQEVAAHNLAQSNTTGFKALRVAGHALPGAAHPVAAVEADWAQGALRDTGRRFDFALEGSGFFVVSTAGGERLTRGGAFDLDEAGRVVDMAGNPLLGRNGPIVAAGGSFEVQENGVILVDGAEAGRLRLESVEDPRTLEREEGGLFASSGEFVPVQEGSVRVRQGRIEDPNLNPLQTLTDLISISRAYAANAQALKAMDRALSIAATEVGDV